MSLLHAILSISTVTGHTVSQTHLAVFGRLVVVFFNYLEFLWRSWKSEKSRIFMQVPLMHVLLSRWYTVKAVIFGSFLIVVFRLFDLLLSSWVSVVFEWRLYFLVLFTGLKLTQISVRVMNLWGCKGMKISKNKNLTNKMAFAVYCRKTESGKE